MMRPGLSAITPGKAPSTGANVLNASERKLMMHIISEREERINAISDLASQLQGLRRELRETSLAREPAPVPSQEQQGNVPSSDLKAEIESQRRALEAQRFAFETQTLKFTKDLEDLRTAHQKAELACQESLSKSMDMGEKLRKDLDEVQTKAVSVPPGTSQRATSQVKAVGEQLANGKAKPNDDQPNSDEGRVNVVPATTSWLSKDEESKKLLDGAFDPEGFRALVRHTKGLEDQFAQQSKEIVSIRTVLIKGHANLLLHAMRLSRIALRSTELSREERRLAFTSLDVKEKQIKEDVDALREKIETCPADALDEIAKVTLEQPF